ncbi:hypothetical protein GIY30_14170 [Gordonia sp. HNM0687]|uniref:ESX-1 secretion-associated protein n=1 Tax=Gordonia mangrovi TaxID=2665643 RepID=A0A6L7GVC8_9ACTN|nr:hypothetical protein [Gordonia mangrovi]MXP22488.1 hypothetical protein [Gordonia mangrovi]UVF77637.1 hypothetical protein NWF22_20570 [Gordonia mangrovi]
MSGGQKASDYVLEPCVAMPEIKPAPDQRDWGQPVDGIVVLSEKGMWEARAKAAEVAADKLRDCLNTASQIAAANYFGRDCEEGGFLRDRLRSSIASDAGWAGAIDRQISELMELARKCAEAAETLESQDRSSAANFAEKK